MAQVELAASPLSPGFYRLELCCDSGRLAGAGPVSANHEAPIATRKAGVSVRAHGSVPASLLLGKARVTLFSPEHLCPWQTFRLARYWYQ